MPLGLPNHLAPRSVARAYASASHSIALYCLLGSLVLVVAIQAWRPALLLWPCVVAIAIMLIGLRVLQRNRATLYAVAYLVVGGACLYWFDSTATLEFSAAGDTDAFVLSLPKLALIFVGAGTGLVASIAWAAAGLVTAEGAVALAALVAGGHYSVDVAPIACFLGITVLLAVITVARGRTASTQPSFTRAARDEHLSAVRYRIEVKAAAIMHDTLLNHLAALAVSSPGELAPALRRGMARDLEVLIGEEWLLDADLPDARGGSGWRESTLFDAIEEVRQQGLEVEVSGDVTAVTRLDAQHALAVGLAAKQCLVNVIRHAGVSKAEVVVYGSEAEVSVMVIDAGTGFSEAETGADRLGLRQSVRTRIEAIDGSVQVWSTPGRGTSVMIRVPANGADAAAEHTEQP